MGTVRYTVVHGEVLSENRNGTKRDYVPDPLGSTVALLDNTQTKTDTFGNWPYGEESSRTGSTPTPFRYVGTQGYYRDSSSRSYVRARVLNTAQGRWMTQDPVGFEGGDWNLYRYVGNNPVTFFNPFGWGASATILKSSLAADHIFPTGNIISIRGGKTALKNLFGIYAVPPYPWLDPCWLKKTPFGFKDQQSCNSKEDTDWCACECKQHSGVKTCCCSILANESVKSRIRVAECKDGHIEGDILP